MSGEPRQPLGHERLFWRRLAHWGATRGPEWWLRLSPPVVGAAASVLVPSARHAVVDNLRRIRGQGSRARDAREVLATFSTYASCIAEVLSNDAPAGFRPPSATILGELNVKAALAARRGLVIVTAHTAGWESAGPLLARDHGLDIMIVMQPEPDARARALQDDARLRSGVAIAHVGDDPLASLPLMRHLRGGGAVALQLDRVVPGMRTRAAPFLGGRGEVPEGPLRLAQLTGAPVVPIFCSREGFRKYVIHVFEPRTIPRHATEVELDSAAAHVADAMTRFLRAHPTQWFHFAEHATSEARRGPPTPGDR